MIIVLIIFAIIAELIVIVILGKEGRELGKDRKIGPVAGFWLAILLGRIGLFIVKRSKKIEQLQEIPTNASSVAQQEQDTNKTSSFEKYQYGEVVESEGDDSILTHSKLEGNSYLDQLAIEVCLHGEQLEKYERMVKKQFDDEVYANMQRFVEEIKHSCQKHHFTNTSIANLLFLGNMIGLSESIVNDIIRHLNTN